MDICSSPEIFFNLWLSQLVSGAQDVAEHPTNAQDSPP